MNNLKLLLKYNFINSTQINKLSKKKKDKETKKAITIWGAALIVAIGIFLFLCLYMIAFAVAFNEQGASDVVLLLGLSISSIMSFVLTLLRADSDLFHCKDFDLLISMPIKTSTIVSSKIINIFIVNYLCFFAFVIPATIAYSLYNEISFMFILNLIIVFITIPLIPITISGLFSYVFGMMFSRLKHKNIITSIILIAATVAIMIFSMSLSLGNTEELAREDIIRSFSMIYYPSLLAFNGIRGDLTQLMIFVIPSILVSLIFVYYVSKGFVKANLRAKKGYTTKNYKVKEQNQNTPISSLIKLELKKYFSFPIYTANTIISPIISVVLIVLFALKYQDISSILGNYQSYLVILCIFIITFGSSISPTTCIAFSIEGKNFWILKTLPIDNFKIFISKVLVTVITFCPFTVLSAIFISIYFKFSFIDFMFILLIPNLIIISIANLGLYINILIPRFDWENITEVVKRSSSLIATMGISFFIIIVLGVISLVTINLFSSLYVTLIIILLIVLILFYVSLLLLKKDGIKRFEKING